METDPIANCLPCANPEQCNMNGAVLPESPPNQIPVPTNPQPAVDTNAAMWAEYYGSPTLPSAQTILTVPNEWLTAGSSVFKCEDAGRWIGKLARRDPPIIIDSGASQSVVGKAWLIHHRTHEPSHWSSSANSFRFGSGSSFKSCGYTYLRIAIPAVATQSKKEMELTIRADVVDTPVPFLISLKTLQSLSTQIDFRSHVIMIPSQGNILCEHSPSGHLLLHGKVESMSNHAGAIFAGTSESLDADGPNRSERERFRLQSECRPERSATSEITPPNGPLFQSQSTETLAGAQTKFPQSHLDQVYDKCKCQHTVGRITPPLVSSVLARRAGKLSR